MKIDTGIIDPTHNEEITLTDYEEVIPDSFTD